VSEPRCGAVCSKRKKTAGTFVPAVFTFILRGFARHPHEIAWPAQNEPATLGVITEVCMPNAAFLTERQQKWFASVREGLVLETGRTLDQWVELARACPETAHRKRLAWMKATHGLGQNRASLVLNSAFPPQTGWSSPDDLAGMLWADPSARAVHDRVRAAIMALPDIVVGQRKGFTAYSRRLQFCAARPAKHAIRVGLALPPDADTCLQPAGREGWSERLLAVVQMASPEEVNPSFERLVRAAWDRS
jgi:hypothetical protein